MPDDTNATVLALGRLTVPELKQRYESISSVAAQKQIQRLGVVPPHPVLARLEAQQSELAAAIEKWCAYMRGRSVRERSIERFKTTLEQAAAVKGWLRPVDLTFAEVTGWVGEQVTSGRWKPNTGDSALVAFRSFTRWATDSQLLDRDPLTLAHGSRTDDAPGSRAATTAELRTLIAHVLEAQKRDRRNTGNRALYIYACCMAGLRFGELGGCERGPEPRGLIWSDLSLDQTPPVIRWHPSSHKGRRHCVLPLHPTLARLLREHRETVPHGPDDKVFPIAATRAAFRKDAERCGIRTLDDRGRAFSPHSCRKWHKSELVRAGVQQDIIDGLMRHGVTTESRYLDLGMEPYVKALDSIPEIWPGEYQKINPPKLDKPAQPADTHCNGTHADPPPTNVDACSKGPDPGGCCVSLPEQTSGSGPLGQASGSGIGSRKQVESNVSCNPPLSALGAQLPVGFEKGSAKAQAMATLLRAVADLIS